MADRKILIVEDNAIIAMETVERLKRLGCSVCGIAATGADAIRLAGSQEPDLILMDINLKGDMDGIEAAETINRYRPVPVIYLTAYSDEETLDRARAGQPFRYLVKPYKERVLYAAIEEAFHQQPHREVTSVPEEMQRFIANLETSDDGVFVVGAHGDIRYLNRQAGVITGWDAGAVTGMPLDEVFSVSSGDLKIQQKSSGALPCNVTVRPCTILSPGGMRIAARHVWIPVRGYNSDSNPAILIFWAEEAGNS